MRNALRITVAAVAGFSLGYLVCKRQLEQSYQDISDSEIADVRADYEKRLKKEIDAAIADYEQYLSEAKPRVIAFTEAPQEVPIEDPDLDGEQLLRRPAAQAPALTVVAAKALTDYTQYSSAPESKPEGPKHKAPDGQPHIISAEAFLAGESGYTQDTLSWYSEDNVLADAGDKIVDGDERALMVGVGILETFVPVEDADHGPLYFRNDAIGMDVEIIRVRGSYKEVVGLGDDSAS